MLSYLQKMKSKKGFTVVELIVVISIIGIMAAIFVPMMNNDDGKIATAREYSKSMYYATQAILVDYVRKDDGLLFYNSSGNVIEADNADPAKCKNYYIITDTTDNGYIADVRIFIGTQTEFLNSTAILIDSTNTNTDNIELYDSISRAMAEYLNFVSEGGTFLTVVDCKLRVEVSYFSKLWPDGMEFSEFYSHMRGRAFSTEGVLDGTAVNNEYCVFGSFPYINSAPTI